MPAKTAKKGKAKRAVKKSAKKATKRTVKRAPRKAAVAPRPSVGIFKRLDLVWFTVTDWERAKRFYSETLGLTPRFVDEGRGWIEYTTGMDSAVAIWRSQGEGAAPAPQGGGIVVFQVDDLYQTKALLESRGVHVEEPQEIPGMVRLASFTDPDGNKFQIAQSLVAQPQR